MPVLNTHCNVKPPYIRPSTAPWRREEAERSFKSRFKIKHLLDPRISCVCSGQSDRCAPHRASHASLKLSTSTADADGCPLHPQSSYAQDAAFSADVAFGPVVGPDEIGPGTTVAREASPIFALSARKASHADKRRRVPCRTARIRIPTLPPTRQRNDTVAERLVLKRRRCATRFIKVRLAVDMPVLVAHRLEITCK